jgi:hypothetical protein
MYWKIWPTKLDRSACSFGLSATSTFLSEQTSHQQSASSTFLSKQISTSRQPPAKRISRSRFQNNTHKDTIQHLDATVVFVERSRFSCNSALEGPKKKEEEWNTSRFVQVQPNETNAPFKIE